MLESKDNMTNDKESSTYVNINVLWRVISFIVSTVFYIFVSIYNREDINRYIFTGMFVSCALSCWLYKRVCENVLHFRVMFSLEVFAYGIFIFLSGGLNSPYLWYEVNCILLMVALDKNILITFIACIWCWICTLTGDNIEGSVYKEANIVLGMLMLMVEFYIVRYYIKCIDEQKEELESLNTELQKEKELSNYAFTILAELSESFGLFAMTDPKKIMEKLSLALKKDKMYSEFVLIKFEHDDAPEIIESYGVDKTVYDDILVKVQDWNEKHGTLNVEDNKAICYIYSGGKSYELTAFGESTYVSGVLVRKVVDVSNEERDFYRHLIKTVFNNLDMYSQIERFVAVEEQNRIANEIHDTVIQKLFGIDCSLILLESKIKNKEDYVEAIKILRDSVENTMAELRESIYGKRFKDNLNTFIHTTYAYMEEVERLNEVSIKVNLDEQSDYIAIAQKIALYRVACEAVNNAIKHGQAKNVEVNLKLNANSIELVVEDDGLGFSKDDKDFHEGNGLKNMRSIAVLLKGFLSILHGEKSGVRVKLSLPR